MHLSKPSLSDNLKLLQKRKNTIKRDIDSRKYSICPEGLRLLRRNMLADTIESGSLVEKSLMSPPVDSILAIDSPDMTEAQQRLFMKGTPDIAKACFDQFILDSERSKGSKNYPTAGRIVYTASIDLSKASSWLVSEDGKKYVEKLEGKEASR